ncbi:hypothetical protein LXL04_027014 [Taraxacum kok-saghyz]
MKKLYRKSTVHPSPPLISDHLALLPAAIFTLTMALSPEDKEVLAYLVSSTNFPTPRKTTTTTTTTTCKSSATTADHPPLFNCSCFRCYTSYWVRWDSSPNRQLIHEIIDAFEDGLIRNKREKNKKDRKKKYNSSCSNEETSTPESTELPQSSEMSPVKLNESDSVPDCEEGSVRKLVNFLGERIWSVWT